MSNDVWKAILRQSILTIPLGLGIAAMIALMANYMPSGFWATTVPLFILTTGGAAGGLLYATRFSRLELPCFKNSHLELGWIADVGFGIGGAFAVSLVTPGLSESLGKFEGSEANLGIDLVEVIALALVGGFGGRALMEQTQATIFRKELDDTNERVVQASENLQQIALNDQAQLAAILQMDVRKPPKSPEELEAIICRADGPTLAKIFFDVQQYVDRHSTERDSGSIERAVPVVKALISADAESKYARTREVLALIYCHLGRWNDAKGMVEEAIAIRDRMGTPQMMHLETIKARCVIEMCPAFSGGRPSPAGTAQEVLSLLLMADGYTVDQAQAFGDPRVREWLTINHPGYAPDLPEREPKPQVDVNGEPAEGALNEITGVSVTQMGVLQ